jgi:hypothetical protein
MSQFAKLIEELPDPGIRVSALLLRARVLAESISGRKLKSWVRSELEGYSGNPADLPSYRVVPLESYGEFAGPGGVVRNVLLPTDHLPADIRDYFQLHRFRDSVGSLEAFVNTGRDRLGIPWLGPMYRYYRQNPGVGIHYHQLSEAHKSLSAPVIEGILHAVRNRLLEFLLQLGASHPDLRREAEAASNVPEAESDALVERYIYNDCTFIGGNQEMSKQEIHAESLSVGHDLIVADRIRGSFNRVSGSSTPEPVKASLGAVAEAVAVLSKSLPADKAEQAARDFDALAAEATQAQPRRGLVQVVGDELIGLAKAAGNTAVVAAVTELVKSLFGG